MALPIVPKHTFTISSQLPAPDRAYVGFLEAPDLLGGALLPFTVTTAISLETLPIIVQGYNTFMGFLNCSGLGTLKVDYGICRPSNPSSVLVYRNLFPSVAVSVAMLATFGARGESVVSFQGDLATAITFKLTAASATVTVNDMVLWFGA